MSKANYEEKSFERCTFRTLGGFPKKRFTLKFDDGWGLCTIETRKNCESSRTCHADESLRVKSQKARFRRCHRIEMILRVPK